MQTIRIMFFAAWLIAGSTIDNIFNSKGAMMTFVIAMIVIVACAAAMGRRKNDQGRDKN